MDSEFWVCSTVVPSLRSQYAIERMIYKLFIHKEQDAFNSSFAWCHLLKRHLNIVFIALLWNVFQPLFVIIWVFLWSQRIGNTFSFEFTSFRLITEALGETKANWLLFFHVWWPLGWGCCAVGKLWNSWRISNFAWSRVLMQKNYCGTL